MWMPGGLLTANTAGLTSCWNIPLEMDGFDRWGTEWVSDDNAGGMMVSPTRVLSDAKPA